MKIVFLDIDGVLVTPSSSFRSGGLAAKAHPDAIAALNHITETTGARIVVTSTWRLEYSPDELREILLSWGVRGIPEDCTPDCCYAQKITRGEEISEWISRNPEPSQIEAFVILDDKNDMGRLASQLVKTDFDTGLQMSHATRAIEILAGGPQ